MVAAVPDVRGQGIGIALARFAVNRLVENGMEDAHLSTDDFRKSHTASIVDACGVSTFVSSASSASGVLTIMLSAASIFAL